MRIENTTGIGRNFLGACAGSRYEDEELASVHVQLGDVGANSRNVRAAAL
jgi:hypothetical protein